MVFIFFNRINGVVTNIDFLAKLASSKPFLAADLDTGFIEKHHAEIFKESNLDLTYDVSLAALYLALKQRSQTNINPADSQSPWNLTNSWRMNAANLQTFGIECHQQTLSVQVELIPATSNSAADESLHRYKVRFDGHEIEASGELDGTTLKSNINGFRSTASVAEHDGTCRVFTQQSSFQFTKILPDLGDANEGASDNSLAAPMNGTIVTLLVEVGVKVAKDDALLVMEAMKMEHTIRAPAAGVVQEFYFQVGNLVDGGAELLSFEVME